MAEQRLLPLAAMEQLLKKAGAERVSESAKKALKQALEEYAQAIAVQALKYASHAGRKTVQSEDIQLAVKK